jgi:two-component sensor histidine kinase/predicted hydrocarbon binding protein
MDTNNELAALKDEISMLKKEINRLNQQIGFDQVKKTVLVPEAFREIFNKAEENVGKYFSDAYNSAEDGEISINGERYILIRSAALSYEFLDIIKEMYRSNGEEEAINIGNNFLFDIGHVLGNKDAKAFHEKMELTDPIQKLSAGPVHFAYTGWANVEIHPESNPTPDENFFLKYNHHNSFEAQAWKKANRISKRPVCIMNSGYSSGWCEESFAIPLTAVEVTCEAKGDNCCTFIMAPPSKINEYLKDSDLVRNADSYEVPVFFQRKVVEDQLKNSLQQKETLLKEVHHRVKNNLQIISSLFRLQLNSIEQDELKDIFHTSLNRVNTMAQIHELIYRDQNLTSINIEEYFRKLLNSLSQVYFTNSQHMTIISEFNLSENNFNPDIAIPLGLILNEVASNSFKYGNLEDGVFNLSITDNQLNYTLIIEDNGPGLPEILPENSLGLALVSILAEQIEANLQVDSTSNGLKYTLQFAK